MKCQKRIKTLHEHYIKLHLTRLLINFLLKDVSKEL